MIDIMKIYMDTYEKFPLGKIFICSNINGLCRIGINTNFEKEVRWLTNSFHKYDIVFNTDKNYPYINQLDEYFRGYRMKFDVPVIPIGTDFQKSVWNVLKDIPYGETISYKEMAIKLGNPRASRAVGQANNRNPIPIIIPCHRVIGSDGSLMGYGGGINIKKYLIEFESNNLLKRSNISN